MPLAPGQNYLGPFYQGGDPMAMNESELQYPGALGVAAWVLCNDNYWRMMMVVQVAASLTIAAGETAYWSDPDTQTVTNVPGTLGRGRIVGIFAVAATAGNYTAIVLKGRKTPVKYLDSPTAAPSAAGLIAIPSATTGRADSLAAGTAATYPPIGVTVGTQDGTSKLANTDVDIWPNTVG